VEAEITLDKAGRLVLPKTIRAALGVGPGDVLKIKTEGDHLIVSAVRERAGLEKERGVWVFRSGTPTSISIPELLEAARNQRTEELTKAPQ
jgi:AbrB family looped-hinge helix DNA binding protein